MLEFSAGSHRPVGWRRESCVLRPAGLCDPPPGALSCPGLAEPGRPGEMQRAFGVGDSTCQGLTSAPWLLCRATALVRETLSIWASLQVPGGLAATPLPCQACSHPGALLALVWFHSAPQPCGHDEEMHNFANILDVNSLQSPLLSLSPRGPRPT